MQNHNIIRVIIASIIAISCSLAACKKPSTAYTQDCSSGTKSFAKDVSPLINKSCDGGQCHGVGNSKGLSTLSTYAQISGNKNNIRSQIIAGNMPKTGTLTNAEKNIIVCWIDAGALNN